MLCFIFYSYTLQENVVYLSNQFYGWCNYLKKRQTQYAGCPDIF